MAGRDTLSKDKILQPFGLVAGLPRSWRSARRLPPKPSAHQCRVPEQEAEMLVVVVIVSGVRWCVGRMVGQPGG